MDKDIQQYSISLKVILKRNDGKILVMKLPQGYSHPGCYDFPWGRIEKKEFDVDLISILKREIKEEVWDIKINISKYPIANWRTYCQPTEKFNWDEYIFFNFYEAEFINWDIQLSNEHDEYMWVDLKKLDVDKHFSDWLADWVRQYLSQKK